MELDKLVGLLKLFFSSWKSTTGQFFLEIYLFIYFKTRIREGGGGGGREKRELKKLIFHLQIPSSGGHSPRGWSHELHLYLPHEWQRPPFDAFHRPFSRELSSWGRNQYPYGMPALRATALPTMPQSWSHGQVFLKRENNLFIHSISFNRTALGWG